MTLGDPDAFGELYRREARPVLRFFARRVLDAESALDLTAETFAQAFAGRQRCRATNPEQARSWLFTIARAQLARFYERGRVERVACERLGIQLAVPQADELERVEELAGLDGQRSRLAAALVVVDDGQRAALRLRVVDELPYPVVAAQLGISEDAARARVSRGLRRLGDALTDPVEEECA